MGDKSVVGLSRMIALRHELDTIANNIANQTTAGFKAKRVLFQEYLADDKQAEDPSKPASRVSLVHAYAGYTDFSGGPLKATGNPLDVAVVDDAFFVVQTKAGERYTRNSAFMLDGSGRLVTTTGEPVLTTAGPLALSSQDGEVTVGADGTISTASGLRGRLRLVRFADPQRLRSEGGNLFHSDQPPTEVPAGQVRLAPGAVETSNVRPVVEMTRAMEITRAYQLVVSAVMKDEDNNELKRLANL